MLLFNKTGEVKCTDQISSAKMIANQGYGHELLFNLSVVFANMFLDMESVLSMSQELTYAMGY